MRIEELFGINIAITCLPLIAYIILVTFKNKLKYGEKNTFIEILLYVLLFLIIYVYKRSGINEYSCFLTIPVLIGYIYKKEKTSLIISIINVLYVYNNMNINIPFTILIYLSYYIIYLKYNDRRMLFPIMFVLTTMIYMILAMYFFKEFSFTNIYVFFLYGLNTFIIICIILKISTLLNTYENIKDFKNEKKIRTFISKVNHEIKNPLVVIKGYLEILNDKDIVKNRKVLLNEINHALDIVNDFKDLNNLTYNKSVFLFNDILKELKYEIIPLYDNKSIKTRFCSDKDIIIYGDRKRIKQVLINIVKNSIESMSLNGKLNIDTHVINNNLVIKVKDNGCGMNKDDLESIFKPFSTKKKNGTGLGLCISKEIIEEHNGSIKYNSVLNKYTIVNISLPINNMDIRNYSKV